MQKTKIGNIFSISSGIIVHGCNAQGVMGSGIAKEVKARYPDCFNSYYSVCKGLQDQPILGCTINYSVPGKDVVIVNGVTQLNYGREVGKRYISYAAVQEVFEDVLALSLKTGLEVNYPLLGAGYGGGDWSVISAIIESVFAGHPGIQRTLWILD